MMPLHREEFARRGPRGLTLVEILVVLSLIAVVTGVAVMGSMQLPSARLRGSVTMITSAIKVAFTRATATSKTVRLVMDLDRRAIWLEESSAPMLVQSKDKSPAAGADPVTAAERAALEDGEKLLKGPQIPRPRFKPIKSVGFGDSVASKGGRPLGRGVSFRSVQTAHDDTVRKEGRAYLYFWPGGLTERASIQLHIGEGADETTLTLAVAPLTGKVTVKAGAAELELPTDDTTASDRTDNGY
ncbi:MAG TPA: prepilin-type N-terminal cleavage/methylation domain-containing protein [Polyangiaceae bacterium]|nr:prepilin-type N-terminal cleavage/methylation domain-containing protein [Polyangiaceae bacterium]